MVYDISEIFLRSFYLVVILEIVDIARVDQNLIWCLSFHILHLYALSPRSVKIFSR